MISVLWNNFVVSLNVVLPLFLILALGYLIKRFGLLNETFFRQGNILTARLLLPALLFVNIYSNKDKSLFNGKLLLFAVISVCTIFFLLMILIPLIEKDNARRPVLIQGILRSNFIIFAIPVVTNLYGPSSAALAATLILAVIPLNNIFSEIALQVFSSRNTGIKQIVRGILTNNLVIAALIAFFCLLTDLRLPLAIERTVKDLSNVTTAFALLVLGGSFFFSGIGKYIKQLSIAVAGRLLAVPLIFIPIAIACGFRDAELAALMALYTAPGAVASFAMAEQAGADGRLAGLIIVLTTAFSSVTIFLFVFVLKSLEFI